MRSIKSESICHYRMTGFRSFMRALIFLMLYLSFYLEQNKLQFIHVLTPNESDRWGKVLTEDNFRRFRSKPSSVSVHTSVLLFGLVAAVEDGDENFANGRSNCNKMIKINELSHKKIPCFPKECKMYIINSCR